MINKICIFLISITFLFAIHFLIDIFEFFNEQDTAYKSPYFSNSYVKEPFTTFVLNKFIKKTNKRTYWTGNDFERWYVLEVKYKEKKYWTIIERIEK